MSKWAIETANYTPFQNAVCYPIGSRDFCKTGFLDIAPTVCARDYKDPKCIIEKID